MVDPQVAIVRTEWGGLTGGPGLTQMAFAFAEGGNIWDSENAQYIVDSVRTFWAAHPGTLPNNIVLTVSPVVDVHDPLSGALIASSTAPTPPAAVTGTNNGSFSFSQGVKIILKTSQIRNRRRIHGGIYIVPCAGDVFSNDGVVTSTPITDWLDALQVMRSHLLDATMDLYVWSRPTTATSNNGGLSEVTGAEIKTRGAVLRGRRD